MIHTLYTNIYLSIMIMSQFKIFSKDIILQCQPNLFIIRNEIIIQYSSTHFFTNPHTQTQEYLFIASYYRQLSAYIKMKNYKIKTSFIRGINLLIIIFFVKDSRTCSNQPYINRFGSHTGKKVLLCSVSTQVYSGQQ